MAKHLHDHKHQVWARRLERYRASGSTIAKFCQSENVAEHTFYYWTRRLRSAASRLTPVGGRTGSNGPRTRTDRVLYPNPASQSTLAATAPATIQLSIGSGVRISIPANCTEALRCIVSSLQDAASPREPDAFQHVVVATR